MANKFTVRNMDLFYGGFQALKSINLDTVSYTHLTLPTILLV